MRIPQAEDAQPILDACTWELPAVPSAYGRQLTALRVTVTERVLGPNSPPALPLTPYLAPFVSHYGL